MVGIRSMRGNPYDGGTLVLRLGRRQGITHTLKAIIERRGTIEPAIKYMQMDGRLACHPLKAQLDNAIHALRAYPRLILIAPRLCRARRWFARCCTSRMPDRLGQSRRTVLA
jgi:hypothetical protein